MKLDLTPEQAFFAGTTRQFLDDKVPTSLLRELRGDPAGFGRDFWRQGADLGWTSLLVPEADGGGSVSGQGLPDLALVAFEFGRYAAPGPLTTANVVTAASRPGIAECYRVRDDLRCRRSRTRWVSVVFALKAASRA